MAISKCVGEFGADICPIRHICHRHTVPPAEKYQPWLLIQIAVGVTEDKMKSCKYFWEQPVEI